MTTICFSFTFFTIPSIYVAALFLPCLISLAFRFVRKPPVDIGTIVALHFLPLVVGSTAVLLASNTSCPAYLSLGLAIGSLAGIPLSLALRAMHTLPWSRHIPLCAVNFYAWVYTNMTHSSSDRSSLLPFTSTACSPSITGTPSQTCTHSGQDGTQSSSTRHDKDYFTAQCSHNTPLCPPEVQTTGNTMGDDITPPHSPRLSECALHSHVATDQVGSPDSATTIASLSPAPTTVASNNHLVAEHDLALEEDFLRLLLASTTKAVQSKIRERERERGEIPLKAWPAEWPVYWEGAGLGSW